MPQEEIRYTIPNNQQEATPNDGANVDLIVTYDPNQNPDGSYNITDASGTYQELNSDGIVVKTATITGIPQPGQDGGTFNQHLFLVDNPNTQQIVDYNGIAYTVSDPSVYATDRQYVDFYNKNEDGNPPEYGSTTTNNGNDATGVTEQPYVCFCSGTRILTARGEVAIEDLHVGDLAVTASGAHCPVRWIGHSTMNPRRHSRPEDVLPVRIRAGALGEGKPARDLLVSPGHGIALDLIGEVIVTAGSLVNGSTVVQEDAERVTYWHVELDGHDLLIAEGQPAESYLDMGNRAFFARHTGEGAIVDLAAGPDLAARTHADFCRPFHGDGPVLAFARQRIEARARALGWHLSDAEPWTGVHLVADGVRVEPEVRGPAARFRAPAGAKDVWLVSPAAAPAELGINGDPRRLGLFVAELRVGEGWDARSVALDDSLLCAGFHAVEGEGGTLRRWTAGRARLPAVLWAGEDRTLVVRLEASSPAMPRWVGPAEAAAAPTEAEMQAGLRLVQAA